MSNVNTKLATMAAVLENPLTFTDSDGDELVAQANVQLLIDLISYEGTDPTVSRLFLDEMSPPARASLYKILVDLKASNTAGA